MVVLTILKICGIVLLGIIGFILLLAIILLLVPFRYRLKADKDDELTARGSVSWLFSIVRLCASYEDSDLNMVLRVFGIPVKRFRKCFGNEEYEDEEEEIIFEPVIESSERPEEKEEEKSKVEESPKTFTDFDFDSVKYQEKPKKKKVHRTGWTDKLNYFITHIKSDEIKNFIRRFKKYLIRLFRHIGPRKLKGSVTFGFDNPAYTGKTLAALAIIYPVYGRHFSIYPDFEEECFFCDAFLRGHLRICSAGFIVLRLLFSKDYKSFKKELELIRKKLAA